MTDEEKIAAEKAKAEAEGKDKTERTFTQADMDLAMAKVRRDEKRKAQAAIAEADKLAAEVKGLRESVPTAEKIQSLIEIAIKNQAAQALAEAQHHVRPRRQVEQQRRADEQREVVHRQRHFSAPR